MQGRDLLPDHRQLAFFLPHNLVRIFHTPDYAPVLVFEHDVPGQPARPILPLGPHPADVQLELNRDVDAMLCCVPAGS
jgi:hypothetical protein